MKQVSISQLLSWASNPGDVPADVDMAGFQTDGQGRAVVTLPAFTERATVIGTQNTDALADERERADVPVSWVTDPCNADFERRLGDSGLSRQRSRRDRRDIAARSHSRRRPDDHGRRVSCYAGRWPVFPFRRCGKRPSNAFEEDGTTAVTAAEIGDVFRYDGTTIGYGKGGRLSAASTTQISWFEAQIRITSQALLQDSQAAVRVQSGLEESIRQQLLTQLLNGAGEGDEFTGLETAAAANLSQSMLRPTRDFRRSESRLR